MRRRRRYIKPDLTTEHKIKRMKFVLSQLNEQTMKFSDLKNGTRGGEKWFYMMHDKHATENVVVSRGCSIHNQ